MSDAPINRGRRIAVIGLDSAPPELVFDRWRTHLPVLSKLMARGLWGTLRSCHPPITVPAWSSMLASRDPGELGLYGFRDRRSFGYDSARITSARAVTAPRVWEPLADLGARSILIGVPQTYPPFPVNGCLVSCFLTPSGAKVTTFPQQLRAELDAICGEYLFDIPDFRSPDREAVRRRIYRKTEQDFAIARHLVTTRPWELFLMVVMGTDRMQHAFWPNAAAEDADARWASLLDYYRYLDREIGELLHLLGDDVVVLVVSDHGAKQLDGGIHINEWLMRHGWLALKQEPQSQTALLPEMIDWSRTRAWGEGGYCGRVFLNVRNREPEGTVAASDYERCRDELIAAVADLEVPSSSVRRSAAFRPDQIYARTNGIAPDLMVYFDDLHWRALGSVGSGSIYNDGNDMGPDGANHDWDGVFILADPRVDLGGRRLEGAQLMDVAPTILSYYGDAGGVAAQSMRGRSLRS